MKNLIIKKIFPKLRGTNDIKVYKKIRKHEYEFEFYFFRKLYQKKDPDS